jgi:hypothetical protein
MPDSVFCPACGVAYDGDARFCGACGRPRAYLAVPGVPPPPLSAPGYTAWLPPSVGAPSPAGSRTTNSETIRTVLLALVLAILIVPFGGPATLPALLIVASLAAFDLWRQAKRREQIAANVSRPAGRFESLNVAQRFAVVVGGFVVFIVVVLVIQTLTKAA